MSRLSTSGRLPISERIKLFDNSVKPRASPATTPTGPGQVAKVPTPHSSPVLKPSNRSQYSAKDPTKTSKRTSPTSSVASSKSDLSRTPSNASTKSSDLSAASRQSSTGVKTADKSSRSAAAANGRNSPVTSRKPVTPSPSKKAVNAVKTTPKSTAAATTTSKSTAVRGGPAVVIPGKQDENVAPASKSPSPAADKTISFAGITPLSEKTSPTPVAEKRHSVQEKKVSIAEKSTTLEKRVSINESKKMPEKRPSLVEKRVSIEEKTVEIGGGSEFRPSEPSPRPSLSSIDTVDRAAVAANGGSRKASAGVAEKLAETVVEKKTSTSVGYVDAVLVNNKKIESTTTTTKKTSTTTSSTVLSNNNNNNMVEEQENLINKKKAGEGVNGVWSHRALNNATAATMSKALKLDGEAKDERISSLQRDISELQMGGASEDEIRALKKSRKDLEMQLKEQEEELDDLAAQVQMLEGSKTKLEMEMATVKKEHRREIANKEEEIEEARASANKKVKILEQQLEQEHEERIMFLRERHDLEQKIGTLQDMLERSGDEEQVSKLKKDLKKTKALLRDAQSLVEKNQHDSTNKVILRQLKNQLEDAEFARTAAMKARQNAELELADTHVQLEDVSRSKQELEDKHLRLNREKAELAGQLQENEEELQEVMRKYKASVAAVSTDQITIQDQQTTIQELEDERNKLRDSVAELSSKLSNHEGENVSTSQHKRLELKIRELESKLELELTSKSRLETQISRLKEAVEKLSKEKDELRVGVATSNEQQKKMSRQLRDMKEDYTTAQGREAELAQKKMDLEKQLEVSEAETLTVRSDLKLALKRIEDLQHALTGEIDSDNTDDNSDSSDDEMHSFMEHHRRAMSVQRERESMARESVLRDSMARESVLRDSILRDSTSMGRESSLAPRGSSVGRSFAAIDEGKESTSSHPSIGALPELDESQA